MLIYDTCYYCPDAWAPYIFQCEGSQLDYTRRGVDAARPSLPSRDMLHLKVGRPATHPLQPNNYLPSHPLTAWLHWISHPIQAALGDLKSPQYPIFNFSAETF